MSIVSVSFIYLSTLDSYEIWACAVGSHSDWQLGSRGETILCWIPSHWVFLIMWHIWYSAVHTSLPLQAIYLTWMSISVSSTLFAVTALPGLTTNSHRFMHCTLRAAGNNRHFNTDLHQRNNWVLLLHAFARVPWCCLRFSLGLWYISRGIVLTTSATQRQLTSRVVSNMPSLNSINKMKVLYYYIPGGMSIICILTHKENVNQFTVTLASNNPTFTALRVHPCKNCRYDL